jgi:hypothetical protein
MSAKKKALVVFLAGAAIKWGAVAVIAIAAAQGG